MKSAVISPCGTYRYRLDRYGAMGGTTIAFIMVNPSTADGETDDQTIRKCLGFASRAGHDHLIVGNLFAFRATDIKRLREAGDRVGPMNDDFLRQIMHEADTIVVAWGTLNKLPEVLRPRWKDVVRIADQFGYELSCLGTAKDGHPLHPLMVGYDKPIIRWQAPWFANRSAAQLSQPCKPLFEGDRGRIED